MQIQSVPQAFFWIKTPPTSSMGEPHACEHLLLGKGNRGRYVASLEDMALANSSAYTAQIRTCYHFNTTAGEETFYQIFEAKLQALLHPDFTDEEIRREVCHLGVVVDEQDGNISIEEKGTVYTEMVSSFEKPWYYFVHPLNLMVYGDNHPLSYVSGGDPSSMRNMTPQDMWRFHEDYYHLANMGTIASIPDEVPIQSFLKQMSQILYRCQTSPDSSPQAGIGAYDFPPVKMAPLGRVEITSYPSEKSADPGYLIYGWPADLELGYNDRSLLELFLETFADGETSNLYDLFINSQTRKVDFGGNYIFSGVDTDLGNSIYIGLVGIENPYINELIVDSIRTLIRDEIQLVYEFQDGSEELAEFNNRVKSRLERNRKQIDHYLNSPPPMFGFRSGVGGYWLSLLRDLEEEEGFRKSLAMKTRFDYAESLLEDDRNFWRDRIDQWRLTSIKPYAVGAVPDSELLRREAEVKKKRIRRLGIPPSGPFSTGFNLLEEKLHCWYSWPLAAIPPTKDGTPVDPCEYDDAALVDGLAEKDAAKLNVSRGKLYELKVRLLQELLRALRCGTAANLWENCLRLLTETLLAEEAEFLLRMDRLYSGFDIRTMKKVSEEVRLAAGGLTDILTVIGHYEAELTFKRFAHTRNALGNLVKQDRLSGFYLALNSYFDAVKEGQRDTLDHALDLFLSLNEKEKAFWMVYRHRVNQALENEFEVEVACPTRIKRKLHHKYEPAIGIVSQLVKSHLEASDNLPQPLIRLLETAPEPENYGFRREDDFWKITYGGKMYPFMNIKGLEYIHFLVRHPWEEFTAPQLEAIMREQPLDPSTDFYREMSKEQLAEENLRIASEDDANGKDDMLDKAARMGLRRTLKEYKQKWNGALEKGYTKKAKHYQQQMESIQKRLRADTGLRGRARKFSGEDKRAQYRVCRAIYRGLESIKRNPPAWRHLDKALKPLGFQLCYRPDELIDWIT